MEIRRLLEPILRKHLEEQHKSILLLGPRQVGKSFLLRKIKPNIAINLAKESEYQDHLKTPSLLQKMIAVHSGKKIIVIVDEIQRLPEMMNTIQALIDEQKKCLFLISGSSARKLKKKNINLLPGRIFSRKLFPLCFWEIQKHFDLEKYLSLGGLPEIYLEAYGPELLYEYIETYLREEIIAEALVRNIASFSRFLDMAALISGKELNYSQLASDSEIPKETLRRYFDILVETLLIYKIPGFTQVIKGRKAIQKEKVIFFDLGVRNGILKIHENKMTPDQLGPLFEQWIILQCIYYNSYFKKKWTISYYRDERKNEVDLVVETPQHIYGIEVKYSEKYRSDWVIPLKSFQSLCTKPCKVYVVYRGTRILKEDQVMILPFENFLSDIENIFK